MLLQFLCRSSKVLLCLQICWSHRVLEQWLLTCCFGRNRIHLCCVFHLCCSMLLIWVLSIYNSCVQANLWCMHLLGTLISEGINAGDTKKLPDAGIYTCNGLMMHNNKVLNYASQYSNLCSVCLNSCCTALKLISCLWDLHAAFISSMFWTYVYCSNLWLWNLTLHIWG